MSAAGCTRVYLAFSEMAHLLEPGVQATAGRPPSLCRRAPQRYSAWLGTGSQAEYERAAELPLCRKCGQAADTEAGG